MRGNKIQLDYDAGQWLKLNNVIALASGEDQRAINQLIEAVGNDDHTNKALVDFMDGVSIGNNPTLIQIQFNLQLTSKLFKCIADYVVAD